jgi:hypothetical protein
MTSTQLPPAPTAGMTYNDIRADRVQQATDRDRLIMVTFGLLTGMGLPVAEYLFVINAQSLPSHFLAKSLSVTVPVFAIMCVLVYRVMARETRAEAALQQRKQALVDAVRAEHGLLLAPSALPAGVGKVLAYAQTTAGEDVSVELWFADEDSPLHLRVLQPTAATPPPVQQRARRWADWGGDRRAGR